MTLKEIFRLIFRMVLGKNLYEKIQFKRHTGYKGDFKNPKTFNEHLCKRKLNENFQEAVLFQDKYAVRDYVKEKIGESYLTKLYQVLDSSEKLDYKNLPDAFVVKATNACGPDSILIVDDKKNIPESELKYKIDKILKRYSNIFNRFYYYSNEWWYAEIPSKIIIEERLNTNEGIVPLDYKFFVFAGKVEYIQVDFGRFINHTRSLFNREWKIQKFQLGYPQGPEIEKPKCLEEMITVAEKLSEGIDFLRVDLYEIDSNRVVFGEITVCPSLGHAKFTPTEWDKKFGDLWPV